MLIHVPNGGFRTARQAAALKKSGVVAGVPDLVLFVPICGLLRMHCGLFIEMKRAIIVGQPRGRVSNEQKEMMTLLASQGYYCAVCDGFEEAKEVLTNYLARKL